MQDQQHAPPPQCAFLARLRARDAMAVAMAPEIGRCADAHGALGYAQYEEDQRESPDEAFGWRFRVDARQNDAYYLHSYTGEVRWVASAQTFAAMTDRRSAMLTEVAQRQRQFEAPQMVLLPSGLTAVQFAHDASWQDAVHPMLFASASVLQQHGVPLQDIPGILATGRRILPASWEAFPHGSPFLSTHPISVLHATAAHASVTADQSTALQIRQTATANSTTHALVWPDSVDGSASIRSELRPRAQGRGPIANHKEHNRRGYNMRQLRKLIKEASSSSSATAADSVIPSRDASISAECSEDQRRDAQPPTAWNFQIDQEFVQHHAPSQSAMFASSQVQSYPRAAVSVVH